MARTDPEPFPNTPNTVAHSPDPMPIAVSIIEDDAGFRETLERVINLTPELHCVSVHPNGRHALAHLPEAHAEVVLVDIRMPQLGGIECVRQLRGLVPQLLPVMLTAYGDDELIFEALRAGAVGYLLKRATPAQIVDAIIEVHEGGSPMTPEIARRIAVYLHESQPTAAKADDHNLTAREREILDLVAQGAQSRKIAETLNIATSTVSNHLRKIYAKLQVNSRAAAVAKLYGN